MNTHSLIVMFLSGIIDTTATLAAIVSPILILLTYMWSQIESLRDVEQILRDRLVTKKSYYGSFVGQVTAIRVYQDNSTKSKIRRLLLFRNSGYVRVEMFILDKKLVDKNLWDGELFEAFCDVRGYDVEFVSSDIEGTKNTGLIFRVNTTDISTIEEFVKMIPAYLATLSDQGWLQRTSNPEISEETEERIQKIFEGMSS
jgi:hypothetical protein